MAKRPGMGEALKAAASAKAAKATGAAVQSGSAPPLPPVEDRRYVPPPSRTGTAPVTVHLSPEGRRILRQLALDEESSVQALMVEAVNMLLAQRGKPEVAAP